MRRHSKNKFLIVGEGLVEGATKRKASKEEDEREFRFSRMHEAGVGHETALLHKLAIAMTSEPGSGAASTTPAAFTYLGQFVDHDLTLDATTGKKLEDLAEPNELVLGRSPLLDLD